VTWRYCTGPWLGPRVGEPVTITALATVSAFGRGADALLAGALAGTPAFTEVRRFDVGGRRVRVAATLPDDPSLRTELVAVVREACDAAGLSAAQRRDTRLLLAVHSGADGAEGGDGPDGAPPSAADLAHDVAVSCGLSARVRAYTSACVAATTAVADAATMVTLGRADRVVVAAGYLVESDQFALFDAGRVMARDGHIRPFSTGRTGLLLGDGVAAVVVESARAVRDRGGEVLARLPGWGRAGDAYHVCRPRPDGAGLARAITAALARARLTAAEIGYVNAHGSGTRHSDTAEAAALHNALGPHAGHVPVSSTKAVHGQALEASGLLELVITVLSLRAGRLPVNAGFLGQDGDCPLDVIADRTRSATPAYALSLNCAFGGANTALLVGTP
jgi:3-oxoacyl-[acyl-carrier-protein] synthase II